MQEGERIKQSALFLEIFLKKESKMIERGEKITGEQ